MHMLLPKYIDISINPYTYGFVYIYMEFKLRFIFSNGTLRHRGQSNFKLEIGA